MITVSGLRKTSSQQLYKLHTWASLPGREVKDIRPTKLKSKNSHSFSVLLFPIIRLSLDDLAGVLTYLRLQNLLRFFIQ